MVALTQWVDVKLGCQHKDHNRRAALGIYANQTDCALGPLNSSPNFMSKHMFSRGWGQDLAGI